MLGGGFVLFASWGRLLARALPISLALVALGAGVLAPFAFSIPDPLIAYPGIFEHITEFALLVAIFATGLKIDRRFSLRAWSSTWRLLAAMLISITLITTMAYALLGCP